MPTSSRRFSATVSCSSRANRSHSRGMDRAGADRDHRYMRSFSILALSPRGESVEQAQLCCSVQAPTLRIAAGIAAELRTTAAHVPRVRAARASRPQRCDWIVTASTPMIPVTLEVLTRWEEAMLAIEQAWPECRFLGWRIHRPPTSRPGSSGSRPQALRTGGPSSQRPQESSGDGRPPSQRQLVIASLLRDPSGETITRQG